MAMTEMDTLGETFLAAVAKPIVVAVMVYVAADCSGLCFGEVVVDAVLVAQRNRDFGQHVRIAGDRAAHGRSVDRAANRPHAEQAGRLRFAHLVRARGQIKTHAEQVTPIGLRSRGVTGGDELSSLLLP